MSFIFPDFSGAGDSGLSDDSEDLADWRLASRLSLIYQPDPLKTMPTGWGTRLIGPEHSGHSVSAVSLNFWN